LAISNINQQCAMWVIGSVVKFCHLWLCVRFDLHSVAQIICVLTVGTCLWRIQT